MSKRNMEFQGGGERYGHGGGPTDTGEDKPQQATAAQLARRKILAAKGKGTPRGSRAGSPAVAGQPSGGASTNPFQSFAPPPQANSFNFSIPGSTPAPSFGGQPQQNGGGMFGSGQQQTNGTPGFGGFGQNQGQNQTPSFGGFGATQSQSQPQTNGFNPSPSFNFGGGASQQTNSTPSTSFGGFSQSQPQAPSQELPKTNGFGFGAQTSQPQQNGSTPAFSFGQSQAPPETSKPASNPFAGFGQPAQTNGEKPAGTGLFGSTPATEGPKSSESIFSTVKPPETRPNMFAQPSANGEQTPKPTFSLGQSAAQPKGEQTPKPPSNPFANFGQSKSAEGQTPAPPASTSLFGQPPAQPEPTSKPNFSFGQPAQTNGEQTPKPASNQFAGFGQPATEKPKENETPKAPLGGNLFAGIGQQKKPEEQSTPFKLPRAPSETEQQTPKPSNIFGGGFGQSQNGATPAFKFSAQQQEDTSMISPDNTPHKPAPTPQQPAAAPAQEEEEPNPNAGKSIFERMSFPAGTSKPAGFSFGTPVASSNDEGASKDMGKSLVERPVEKEAEGPVAPATAPRPSFGAATSTSVPAPPLFSALTPAPASSFTPAPQQHAHPEPSAAPAASVSATYKPVTHDGPADKERLKRLNEGLLAHLKTEDPSQDWSIIFHYYLDEAAKCMGKEAVVPPALKQQPVAPTPAPAPQPQPTAQTPAPAPAPLFSMPASAAPKPPATPAAMNIFSQAPPATAPVNRKRSADEQLTPSNSQSSNIFGAPATEKRAKPSAPAAEPVSYPKLPDTASKTAQLFASTLEKPSAATSANGGSSPRFGPSEDLMAKVRAEKAAKAAAEAKEEEGGSGSGAPAAFKPSTTFQFSSAPAAERSKEAETPAAAAPSTSTTWTASPPKFGFAPPAKPPSFGAAPSGDFLSAFGAAANKEAEKAKKRRMDEDYDSDEETREDWEKKDRETQEAKKRKIEEAAKAGSAFGFKPAGASNDVSKGNRIFKVPGAQEVSKAKEQETPAKSNPFAGFAAKTPAQPAPTPAPVTEKPAKSNPFAGFAAKTPSQPATTSAPSTEPPAKSNPFAGFAAKPPSQTPAAMGGSIFSQAPKPALPSGFKFGAGTPANDDDDETDKAEGEKEQGTGDHTWKPETPIKFGGAAAATGTESTTPAASPPSNPFGGLFGSNATPKPAEAGKLAPPSMGFTFGPKSSTAASTADVSRATTPGVTTDGEASNAGGEGAEEGGPSDEQKDEQIEDKTALMPEETANDDLIYSVPIAKAQKYDDKNTDSGASKGWVDRGKGPLYILKNKESGRLRVLLKIPPLGKAAMNFGAVKGGVYQHLEGKKSLRATFVDHFDKGNGGKPSSWLIQVKEVEQAREIARLLEEARDSA